MGTFVPLAYRTSVDHVLNQGFRVWNNTTFRNVGYDAVPYELVVTSTTDTSEGHYNNVEQNYNNDEVCLLCNVNNDYLLSGAPSNAS